MILIPTLAELALVGLSFLLGWWLRGVFNRLRSEEKVAK